MEFRPALIDDVADVRALWDDLGQRIWTAEGYTEQEEWRRWVLPLPKDTDDSR